jgi:hypothetical protein
MTKKFEELLEGKPVFINIGPSEFADSLRRQDFIALDVLWWPPAGGDRELADLLDRLL